MTGARRTPGKPSRLDPTEPLHMTTRRAAKGPSANGSPSVNGSIADNESQRGSAEIEPATLYHNGRSASPMQRRNSDVSATAEGATMIEGNEVSSADSKKRKRSSPHPSDAGSTPEDRKAVPGLRIVTTQEGRTLYVNGDQDVQHHNEEGDFVEVVPPEDLDDRHYSESSVHSSANAQIQEDPLVVTQSVDATPLHTAPGSPATSESSLLADSQRKGITITVTADEDEDQEDAPLATQGTVDAEDIEEAEDAAKSGEEVAASEAVAKKPAGKRRRGRGRALHANPRVEAVMRRQTELKTAYRTIVRALKPVLNELAQRTLDGLNGDPTYHETAEEHDQVQAALDAELARRKRQIHLQAAYCMQHLEHTLEQGTDLRIHRAQRLLEDMKEKQLSSLDHQILNIVRAAQVDEDDQGYETQNEDNDVIPRPKGVAYRNQRKGALDLRHDSRSRMMIETERATDVLERRIAIGELLSEFQEPRENTGFTVMDSTVREVASVNRDSITGTQVLAAAAAEVERAMSLPPPIRQQPQTQPLSRLQTAPPPPFNLDALASIAVQSSYLPGIYSKAENGEASSQPLGRQQTTDKQTRTEEFAKDIWGMDTREYPKQPSPPIDDFNEDIYGIRGPVALPPPVASEHGTAPEALGVLPDIQKLPGLGGLQMGLPPVLAAPAQDQIQAINTPLQGHITGTKRSHSVSEGSPANMTNNGGYNNNAGYNGGYSGNDNSGYNGSNNSGYNGSNHSGSQTGSSKRRRRSGKQNKDQRHKESRNFHRREYWRNKRGSLNPSSSRGSFSPMANTSNVADNSPSLPPPSPFGQHALPPRPSFDQGGWRGLPQQQPPPQYGFPLPPPPQAMPVNHFAAAGLPAPPHTNHRQSFPGFPGFSGPPAFLPPPQQQPQQPPPLHYSPNQPLLWPHPQQTWQYGQPQQPPPYQQHEQQQQQFQLPPPPMYGGPNIAPANLPGPPAFAQGRDGGGRRRHTEGGAGMRFQHYDPYHRS